MRLARSISVASNLSPSHCFWFIDSVAAQRKLHQKVVASGEKTPAAIEERFRRLDEIGFQWTAKDPRHVPWAQRYRELVEFVERFGHAQVPIGWKENRCLSNWVSAQVSLDEF